MEDERRFMENQCDYCGQPTTLIAVVNDSEVELCDSCMAVIRRHVAETR